MSIQDDPFAEVRKQVYARPGALNLTLGLLFVALVVVVWRIQPPIPKGINTPLDEFSAGRAFAVLESVLVEDAPHPTGSEADERVISRIVAEFEGLGYEVSLQETVACRRDFTNGAVCAPVKNILARLDGRGDNPAVLLLAHHDSRQAAPGAADDLSGVVTILEIARILKEEGPFENPIIYLITDAEEVGLLGAQAFVDEHPWAREVGAVINIEARGTSGQSLMFETSDGNAWLVEAFSRGAPRPVTNSLMYEAYKLLPNDTDFTVFKEAGFAGLNFAYIEGASKYHTSLDNLANLNPASLQHHGDNVLAVVRELARMDLSNPQETNDAYLDILGFGVVRWAESWTVPMIAFAMILIAGSVIGLIQKEALSTGALLWGVLSGLLSLLLPVALGVGITWIIRVAAGESDPWHAYPIATRVSLWAGVLFVNGILAIGFSGRAGFWGLGLGAWTIWSLLTLALGLTLVGVAAIFLLPLLFASVGVAVVVFLRLTRRPNARDFALIVPVLLAGVIFFQLAILFEVAMGLDTSPAVTLWLALLVAVVSPFFVMLPAKTRGRNWLVAAAGIVAVLAAVVAVYLPPYSQDNPQRFNFFHLEDRDRGEAFWIAEPVTGGLPEPVVDLFEAEPQVILPWMDDLVWFSEASRTLALEPEISVLEGMWAGGERTVRLGLDIPGEAAYVQLYVPIEDLLSISFHGKTFLPEQESDEDEFYSFTCYALACSDSELTLRLGSPDLVEILVTTVVYGLPEGGEAFAQARPETAAPSYLGDLSILMRSFRLGEISGD